MEKNAFLLVLLVVVAILVGCTVVVTKTLEPPDVVMEPFTGSFIASTLRGNVCQQQSIMLFNAPRGVSAGKIEKTCGGVWVIASEKAVTRDMTYVYVSTRDGKRGWMNGSLLQTEPICTANDKCISLKKFGSPGICDAGICVSCITTRDCTGSLVCLNTTGSCVQCLGDTDCTSGKVCLTSKTPCVSCITDAHCPSETPFCLNTTSSCAACRTNYDCPDTQYCTASHACADRK